MQKYFLALLSMVLLTVFSGCGRKGIKQACEQFAPKLEEALILSINNGNKPSLEFLKLRKDKNLESKLKMAAEKLHDERFSYLQKQIFQSKSPDFQLVKKAGFELLDKYCGIPEPAQYCYDSVKNNLSVFDREKAVFTCNNFQSHLSVQCARMVVEGSIGFFHIGEGLLLLLSDMEFCKDVNQLSQLDCMESVSTKIRFSSDVRNLFEACLNIKTPEANSCVKRVVDADGSFGLNFNSEDIERCASGMSEASKASEISMDIEKNFSPGACNKIVIETPGFSSAKIECHENTFAHYF